MTSRESRELSLLCSRRYLMNRRRFEMLLKSFVVMAMIILFAIVSFGGQQTQQSPEASEAEKIEMGKQAQVEFSTINAALRPALFNNLPANESTIYKKIVFKVDLS